MLYRGLENQQSPKKQIMCSPWKIKMQAEAVSQKWTLSTTGKAQGSVLQSLTYTPCSSLHSPIPTQVHPIVQHNKADKRNGQRSLSAHISKHLSFWASFLSSPLPGPPSSAPLLLGPPPQLPSSWAPLLSSPPPGPPSSAPFLLAHRELSGISPLELLEVQPSSSWRALPASHWKARLKHPHVSYQTTSWTVLKGCASLQN